MVVTKKIAVLCNYELLPERVGGMDYFFWLFDAKCKQNNIQIDWFFPNNSNYGEYPNLTVINCNYEEVQIFFNQNYSNQNYSHIITHFIELCTPFFKSIKKKTKAKIIAVDHNPRPINGYPFKKKLEKKVKGFLYSKFIDVFVGVSTYSKNQICIEFGSQIKNKSIIIFNGIKAEKYLQKTDFNFKGKFIVACHLRKDKGIQDLITAVHEIQKQFPLHFTVDIYGKGDYQVILEDAIHNFSLQNIFNFKGNVTNLNELYGQYDYLIHPSHGETFCYSVVESLLSTLPVITTKNQGNVLGLVIENENGFLFEECDTKKLSEIISSIISNNISISDFSQNNSEIVKLSLDSMVENYYKLLL